MKYILYYSNFCKHCENILSILSKSQLKDSIYFVNIDNRVLENGKMCILLQNGKKLVLPKSVKEVPSLILLHQGNIVLEGKQILDYFKDALKKEETYEPLAFSIDEMNGMSDGYAISHFEFVWNPSLVYSSIKINRMEELLKFMK